MSKMMEYLQSIIGYDSSGLPACTTQFAFGFAPFQVAESENIADVTQINCVCECDAVIDLKIVDDFASITFDFTMDAQTYAEFAEELDRYNQQKEHVTASLNEMMAEIELAKKNGNVQEEEDLMIKIRSMSVPFIIPTIIPLCYGGVVTVSFADDPKFTMIVSDSVQQFPFKIALVYEASDIFAQDSVDIYTQDTETDIEAEQQEMWYMQEAKKLEEDAYQAQFGSAANLYDNDEPDEKDKRLKGVRFK